MLFTSMTVAVCVKFVALLRFVILTGHIGTGCPSQCVFIFGRSVCYALFDTSLYNRRAQNKRSPKHRAVSGYSLINGGHSVHCQYTITEMNSTFYGYGSCVQRTLTHASHLMHHITSLECKKGHILTYQSSL